ncbi:lipid-A-disaccharide synthase [Occallatibacter riparius]|uniref:Lipid-A-disaccharide synthase n=1 Tax=Occallatibacter riparius TaxID=1002689 RepID=A0A9J7BQM2_9BACT|nr:lipid-A-disaccharide synthase [Occallatibacter riparius]UWZ84042.1 lipid-A-disaccharide synthase [Occallatibacter riparius]
MTTPGILISAGEASGEAYGALLIEELRYQLASQNRQAQFWGMGGPRMVAAGLDRVVRAEDMAVMGITEVVRHLPRIYREFRRLKQAIRDRRPAVAVLIDFPDIHFKLAEELHRLGIPVIFFVSPQLWAWKKHRIKLVQKYIDRMLVIFPFEEQFYRERGVNAEFVGHPLAEIDPPTVSREDFARQHDLDPAKTWIGLLPGSRAKEIRDNLPEMLSAADELHVRNQPGQFEFILPLAPTLTVEKRAWVRQFIQQHAVGLPVTLVDEARPALHLARGSIVASGTATVEAALIGNPFVVVYRVSPLTYAIAKRVVTVPHVAMVNLIAQKRLIPELIQNDFTASNIVKELTPLLPDGTPRQSMMKELAELRGLLQTRTGAVGRTAGAAGAIARAAEITLELLESSGAARIPAGR